MAVRLREADNIAAMAELQQQISELEIQVKSLLCIRHWMSSSPSPALTASHVPHLFQPQREISPLVKHTGVKFKFKSYFNASRGGEVGFMLVS